MVNASLNWASFVGIALAASGAGLYALRSLRPRLARDHDIFFAAIALLCGGILFFQGWRLDPILQFNQFLLAGTAIFFAYESIRLRGAATEQAKRNTPIVDDERPVSRVYRADLEELNPTKTAQPLGGFGALVMRALSVMNTKKSRAVVRLAALVKRVWVLVQAIALVSAVLVQRMRRSIHLAAVKTQTSGMTDLLVAAVPLLRVQATSHQPQHPDPDGLVQRLTMWHPAIAVM
jgi:hypothetical protein